MKKIITGAMAISLLIACGPKKEMTETNSGAVKTVATVTMTEQGQQQVSTVVDGHLRGVHGEQVFNEAPYNMWFTPGYETYSPESAIVSELSKELEDVEIRAYMGTWCGDSKREVPKLFKLLDLTGYDQDQLTLVAVDRAKTEPAELVEGYNVSRVPTFIFYRDGKELGRFVEYPRESIEQDILKIVTGQEYKHSYEN